MEKLSDLAIQRIIDNYPDDVLRQFKQQIEDRRSTKCSKGASHKIKKEKSISNCHWDQPRTIYYKNYMVFTFLYNSNQIFTSNS